MTNSNSINILVNKSRSEEIYQVFSNSLGRKVEIGTDISRSDTPEWNSLRHMEIMFSLEEVFDTQFTEEELTNLSSINLILKRLE
jgi:acyl carrier protein